METMYAIIPEATWQQAIKEIEQVNIRLCGKSDSPEMLAARAQKLILSKYGDHLIVPKNWQARLKLTLQEFRPQDEPAPVTWKEIEGNSHIVCEVLEYLRWLAINYPEITLMPPSIWRLYEMSVREGLAWSEVCETLDLPVREG